MSILESRKSSSIIEYQNIIWIVKELEIIFQFLFVFDSIFKIFSTACKNAIPPFGRKIIFVEVSYCN
jgi:hypothetical protein